MTGRPEDQTLPGGGLTPAEWNLFGIPVADPAGDDGPDWSDENAPGWYPI